MTALNWLDQLLYIKLFSKWTLNFVCNEFDWNDDPDVEGDVGQADDEERNADEVEAGLPVVDPAHLVAVIHHEIWIQLWNKRI